MSPKMPPSGGERVRVQFEPMIGTVRPGVDPDTGEPSGLVVEFADAPVRGSLCFPPQGEFLPLAHHAAPLTVNGIALQIEAHLNATDIVARYTNLGVLVEDYHDEILWSLRAMRNHAALEELLKRVKEMRYKWATKHGVATAEIVRDLDAALNVPIPFTGSVQEDAR